MHGKVIPTPDNKLEWMQTPFLAKHPAAISNLTQTVLVQLPSQLDQKNALTAPRTDPDRFVVGRI